MAAQNFDVGFSNSSFYGSRTLTLRLAVSTNNSPSTNTSSVNWSLQVIVSGGSAFNNNNNPWSVNIGGTTFSGNSTWSGNNSTFTIQSSGSPGRFAPSFTHNSDGTRSISVSFSYTDWKVVSGSGTFTLDDYNRNANTPSLTEVTRTSASNFRVNYDLSGSVNGPTTYVVQRSTTSNFLSGVTDYVNPARPFDIPSDANTTYWFRIYASGDEGGNKFSNTVSGPYFGQPTSPSIGTPTQITNSQKRISVPFSGPSYTGSGITSYTITRTGPGSTTKSFTNISSSPFIDTDADLIPGTAYTYTVTALSSGYTSNPSASSAQVIAPGPPYAPTSAPTFTVNGLDITVTSAAVSGNGGVAIDTGAANQGYYLQYQTSTTLDGTYSAWSAPVKMSDQSNRQHTLASLTPALFYKFRVYAANTVIFGSNGSSQLYYPHNNSSYTANFATTETGYFLAAGGRRWTGTEWVPTANAKRWDGTQWVPFNIAKRWTGTDWVNLS